jgi:hypothetical protein
MKFRDIDAFLIERCQRGFRVTIAFQVDTARQCTKECHHVVGNGKTIPAAALNAWQNARAEYARLRTLPGEWAVEKGLSGCTCDA